MYHDYDKFRQFKGRRPFTLTIKKQQFKYKNCVPKYNNYNNNN